MQLNKIKKFVAAVSGGPDSMAMLDKYKKFIKVVAHVNYHKRIDSDYDTKLVKEYCLKNNINLEILNVNKNTYINATQHNFQTLARTIRYDFFLKVAKKYKCFNLIVAHNLNDFLETAIMQKNRKSLNFFYGIKEISSYKELNVYRPLINVWKADLEDYCKKNSINYAIDSSNSQDIYERNRIRKQINCLSLKKRQTLLSQINKRNENKLNLQTQVNHLFEEWKNKQYSVDFIVKNNLKNDVINGLIYYFLKKHDIENITHNKITLVCNFIYSNKSQKKLRLSKNLNLLKSNKKLIVRKQKIKN